jgi:hypothetical protein
MPLGVAIMPQGETIWHVTLRKRSNARPIESVHVLGGPRYEPGQLVSIQHRQKERAAKATLKSF